MTYVAKHAPQRDGRDEFRLPTWHSYGSPLVRNEVGNVEGSAQRLKSLQCRSPLAGVGTNECQYSLASMMVSTRVVTFGSLSSGE